MAVADSFNICRTFSFELQQIFVLTAKRAALTMQAYLFIKKPSGYYVYRQV